MKQKNKKFVFYLNNWSMTSTQIDQNNHRKATELILNP